MSTLVLLEFAEDVPAAFRLASEGATIVALTPEVMEACDAAGQVFEPWTTIEQHSEGDELATDSLRRVTRLSTLDGADSPDAPSVVRCHAHELHVLLCTVAFRALALRELVESWTPTEIVAFQPADIGVDGLMFRPHESAMAAVTASAKAAPPPWAGSVIWRQQRSEVSPRRVGIRIARNSGRAPWRAIMSEWQWARRARDTWQRRRSLRTNLTTGSRVMVLGGNPEFAFLSGADQPNFVHWPAATLPPLVPRQSVAPRAIAGLPDLPADLTTWVGLDCRTALSPRWQWLQTQGAGQVTAWRSEIESVLDAVAPAAVVHGEIGAQSWPRTAVEMARARGIPRAFLQWGGNYGYMRQHYLALSELQSDVVLSYTNQVAADLPATTGLDSQCPPRRVVGSPQLSALRRNRAAWRKTSPINVVYAPLALTGHTRYGPHLCLDDTLFCAAEWRIAEVLAAAFAGSVHLKQHPRIRAAIEPLRSRLKRKGLHVSCSTAPLESMLQPGSVWVIDGLATTLQQLVMARQSIVYVNIGGPAPTPAGERAIRAAVEWVDFTPTTAPAVLVGAINRAASDGPRAAQADFESQFITDEVNGPMFADRVRRALP